MKAPFFQDLGVGVGLRPDHYDVFLQGKPDSVSWVEVISENYMDWRSRSSGRPVQTLERIRRDCPVVLHGVSLNLGSADPLDPAYLKSWKKLIERIQPAWVSDHLCWTGIDGENLHDLLPLPYTIETLQVVTDKIKQVQDFLGRRILVENPSSYVQFRQSEMSEWEFLHEMAERADCGILLDVNNVYVSSVNHGFDPMHYLRAIPSHRVGQIHLAGHIRHGNFLIDTHDQPVREEVWSLYQWTAENLGKISAMVERDDNIPEWAELEAEVSRISRIRRKTHEHSSRGISATL